MTQASAGDHFYFVGIEMPHQYVLWAEERLDQYKRAELDKVSDVDSTIVVQLDKVRLNQLQEGESKPLLNSVRVGNNIKVADSRFIQSPHETLHLQSVTYTWDANTIMLPNIEVVLSDEIATYSNPFADINRKLGDAEDKIKDVRKTSLAQIDKAKKSIRNTSSKINALSTGNANITNQVNVLIGDDKWMSVREIAEDVLGEGGEVNLDEYLSKDEAKDTYATIEALDKKASQDDIKKLGEDIGKTNTTISALDARINRASNTATVASTNANKALTTLDTLMGDGEGSISRQITEEVASIIASAPEDLEMLEEIADFLESDPTQAAEIVTKLDDHEKRLNSIDGSKLVVLSQSEYDAIESKEEDTLYFIYEG
jgi:hypothetical protein